MAEWGMAPDAIDEYMLQIAAQAPDLDAELDLDPESAEIYSAFFDLSPSRSIGFGIGGIPGREIFLHADRFGFVDVEFFFRVIRAMDAAFLDHEASKQARTRAGK